MKIKHILLCALLLFTPAAYAAQAISDFTALTTPADGDLVPIVDISDTTDAATGTTKKVTGANLKTYMLNGNAATATALAANPADCSANNFATAIAANGDLTCAQPSVSAGISGFGTGVATALGVNIGSAGAPVLFNGAGGTPSSLTGTNISGTGANYTAGQATAALGLKTATSTVSISASTAPAGAGYSLITTDATTATWQQLLSLSSTPTWTGAHVFTSAAPQITAGVNATTLGSIKLFGNTSGDATIRPAAAAGTATVVTLPNASSTLPIFGQQITFAGPTAARTITLPDAAFTAARTDAAQTFTGTQTITQIDMGNTDTSITRSAAGVLAVEGVVVTRTIASGAKALATSAIASGACSSAQTDTATGTATTDTITWVFNADPTAVTGYTASANGMLTIIVYPTADTANFKVCNNTASSITPGAITLNWKVLR